MSVLFKDNFDATAIGSLPSGWTSETPGAWTTQAAPSGMSGNAARAAQDTAQDDYLTHTFPAVTSDWIGYRFKGRVGSNNGTGYRWFDVNLCNGTTSVLRLLQINGNIALLGNGTTLVSSITTAANTVYDCVIYLKVAGASAKAFAIVNGVVYDNGGAYYSLTASSVDRVRVSNFSGSAVGGDFEWHDDPEAQTLVTPVNSAPLAGTIGAATVDRFARVTLPFTAGGGAAPSSVKVLRSADNTTFSDITSQCDVTDNGGGSWTVIDRRPHFGPQKLAYGGTGYYRVVATNLLGDGPATATTTVAGVDINLASILSARSATLSSIMGGTFVASQAAEVYPGYWLTAMAYAYYTYGVTQYKTDVMNQLAYIATLATSDGLLELYGESEIDRDAHSRTLCHAAIAARLLRAAGATTEAQQVITKCDIWAKAFFDALNSGNPAPNTTVVPWDPNNTTGLGVQVPAARSTTYALGDVRRPDTNNGHLYRCEVAGTTGSSAPAWNTTSGSATTDGTVTWREMTEASIPVSFISYSATAPHAGGTQRTDLNQNAEEALWCALLLTDPMSAFSTAGTYRTKAQTHVDAAVRVVLAHETSLGAIPIGTSGIATPTTVTEQRWYDTLYGNYTLQQLAGVQNLLPTLNPYLSGFIARGLQYSLDNFYGVEETWKRRRYSQAEPGIQNVAAFYDLIYLDAAASVVGHANPISRAVWTTAFQNPATDRVFNPNSSTGSPGIIVADPVQAEMLDGRAFATALALPTVEPIGVAQETDSALPATPLIGPTDTVVAVGLATETDTSAPVTLPAAPLPPRSPSQARVDVPHFALPFRFVQGRAAVNEQDSIDDVAACVEAVLRTRRGEREDIPEFGIVDPTFSQLPLAPSDLVRQVETWEPRAHILATEAPDVLDETVRRVRFDVSIQE